MGDELADAPLESPVLVAVGTRGSAPESPVLLAMALWEEEDWECTGTYLVFRGRAGLWGLATDHSKVKSKPKI